MKLWCPVTRTITFAFSITELSANKKDISAGLSFSPFNFTRRESASTSRCYCLSILDSDSPSFLRLREREREREREKGVKKKKWREKGKLKRATGGELKGKTWKPCHRQSFRSEGTEFPGVCLVGFSARYVYCSLEDGIVDRWNNADDETNSVLIKSWDWN